MLRTVMGALMVGLVGFGLVAGAAAQGSKPAAVAVEVAELKAKVDAVDQGKRLVTLTGPAGNTVTVKAGKEVRNLAQVKAGDVVTLRYYDSIALFVRKSAEPPGAAGVSGVELAPKGQKPAGVMVDMVEMTATVEAIDYDKRTVTLKGPAGKTKTITVDPSVQRFKEVKKGDELVVRHTEALAIAVDKP
jgi:hypothetical protein